MCCPCGDLTCYDCALLPQMNCYVITCTYVFFIIKRRCFNGLGESVMQQQDSLLACELREWASLQA